MFNSHREYSWVVNYPAVQDVPAKFSYGLVAGFEFLQFIDLFRVEVYPLDAGPGEDGLQVTIFKLFAFISGAILTRMASSLWAFSCKTCSEVCFKNMAGATRAARLIFSLYSGRSEHKTKISVVPSE